MKKLFLILILIIPGCLSPDNSIPVITLPKDQFMAIYQNAYLKGQQSALYFCFDHDTVRLDNAWVQDSLDILYSYDKYFR